MNKTKMVTIICWLVTALVLIGLVIWLITGNLFGFKTGFTLNMPTFHIGSYEELTGPFNEVGNYTVEADNINSLNVDWVSGEISITPYDGTNIKITEYARRELDEKEKLAYNVSGNTLNIEYTENALNFNLLTKKLEVFVPQELADKINRLFVNATSAELTVSSFTVQELEIHETSGTSDLTNIQSDTAGIYSVSGEINLTGLKTSQLTMSTVSGEVTLSDVTADIVICDTTSGDQYFEGTFKSLDLNSVSGELSIVSSIDPDEIRCDTTSGDITLTIPGNDDVVVSYSTVSGDFGSEVPVITAGSAAYNFNTVSGDMHIKKS